MDLSIIIPTYKTGEYFKETIESIKCQDFSDYGIEVIVVLNGEKEPYLSFLKQIKEQVFPFKLIYTNIKGVSNARNLGIEKAQGKYLLFLDDDDLLSENYINFFLLNAKDEETIYTSNVLCFKDGEKEFYKDYIGRFIDGKTNKSKDESNFSILRHSKLMSSSCFKLISKKIIGNIRFNTSLSISEDALFMFEASRNIKNIKICDSIFYYRRVRDNSALKTKKSSFLHIKNFFKFTHSLTIVYLRNMFTLNFLFYLNRLMASTKFLINNVTK